jgi:hypothetical protein
MSKVRYGKDKFEHPYKPWKDSDEKGFRAFKVDSGMKKYYLPSPPGMIRRLETKLNGQY